MKLLLHICCANCAAYPVARLKEEGFELTGYFYNPNIHPSSEYKARKDALVQYLEAINLPYIISRRYDIESFFRTTAGKEEFPVRCSQCYHLRLQEAANFAGENNFKYFTTTLLISPYQQHDEIKRIGELLSRDSGALFYYEDFRPGFRSSHQMTEALNLYHQKYCGCIFSERERFMKEYRPKKEEKVCC